VEGIFILVLVVDSSVPFVAVVAVVFVLKVLAVAVVVVVLPEVAGGCLRDKSKKAMEVKFRCCDGDPHDTDCSSIMFPMVI